MTAAADALRPGDVLAVRTSGLAAELIRVGEELSGKVGLENHIAIFSHYDSAGVPWLLEGRPGGVGWADGRPYLASPFTIDNCLQPGRGDGQRVTVAKQAEALLGDKYDWAAIGGDALAALHVHLWNPVFPPGLAPGGVVCSSLAAWLYEQAGWDHPDTGDERQCEPADWCAYITEHHWSATINLLRLVTEGSGASPVVNITEELIWDLQDQVQRGNQMLAALCVKAGIDPDQAGRLPGEAAARRAVDVELPAGTGAT